MNEHEALLELVAAIESKYYSESTTRRANGLSPRIEDALAAAKLALGGGNCPECDMPIGHLRHCSRA